MGQRGRDPVEEGLAADEAVVGEQVGAIGKMLARSEADLEMERPVVAEQTRRGDVALGGDGEPGQQRFDERGLLGAQFMPGRAAVEAIDGGRVGGHGRAA